MEKAKEDRIVPNVAETNHPLEGHRFTYRPNDEPYIGQFDEDLIIGNGMEFLVVKVFHNWNDVEGLSMMYVFVPDTMHYTHISFGEAGINEFKLQS